MNSADQKLLRGAARLLNDLTLGQKPEGHELAAALLRLADAPAVTRVTLSMVRYMSRTVQARIETEGGVYTMNYDLAPGDQATQPTPLTMHFPLGPGYIPNASQMVFEFRPADLVLLDSIRSDSRDAFDAVQDLRARVNNAIYRRDT